MVSDRNGWWDRKRGCASTVWIQVTLPASTFFQLDRGEVAMNDYKGASCTRLVSKRTQGGPALYDPSGRILKCGRPDAQRCQLPVVPSCETLNVDPCGSVDIGRDIDACDDKALTCRHLKSVC